MSTSEQPPRRGLLSAEPSSRPGHGHQPPDERSRNERLGMEAVDPHPAWLKRWRCLRTDLGIDDDADRTREAADDLQAKIAHTPAQTLAGLQAQAELIAELAWNDVVAATARQLLAGIKRLRRSGPR